MFCDNCGQSVADNSVACNFCGQPFGAASAVAAHPEPVTRPGTGAKPKDEEVIFVIGASRKVLGALERGSVIRRVIATALRIIGLLIVLGGIYALIQVLKFSFQYPAQTGFPSATSSTAVTIGGLVLAAVLIAGFLAMQQTCFYQAASIERLGESSFPVMSVFSILFRTTGEMYAILLVTTGLGGCLFIWFSGMNPMMLLNQLSAFLPSMSMGNTTFLDGLEFLIEMAIAGFVVLVFFYFLAELVLVLADIAKNVRQLAKADEKVS